MPSAAQPCGRPAGDPARRQDAGRRFEATRDVDPEEVRRYHELAATWWDPAGPFWPLHRLNALRSRYLAEVLPRYLGAGTTSACPLEGVSVLDVGCGGGLLAESMAALGARVHGIDAVPRNIEIARLHAQQSWLEIDYRLQKVEALRA